MVHIVTGSLFVGLLECSRPKVPPPIPKKRNREADFAPAGCKFCRCLNSILRCLVDLGWRSKGDTSFAGSLLMISHHRKLQPIASLIPFPTCASYRRAKWFYQLPCSGWFCKLFQCLAPLFGGFCLPCPELIQIVGWSLLSPFHLHESSSTLVFVLNFGSVFTPCTSSSQIW